MQGEVVLFSLDKNTKISVRAKLLFPNVPLFPNLSTYFVYSMYKRDASSGEYSLTGEKNPSIKNFDRREEGIICKWLCLNYFIFLLNVCIINRFMTSVFGS